MLKPRVNKRNTFNFFNYKWSKVPNWARETEHIYRKWYLDRYGYGSIGNLRKFLKDKEHILEAGCGLARDSKMFGEASPESKILAIDQSPNAVRVALSVLKDIKNSKVIRADITNFHYPHKFDFISCDQVIHHTPNVGKTLKYLFGKLNAGGVINFSVCKKKNKYRDLADDLIMARVASMTPDELWDFSVKVTEFGKALHGLGVKKVKFGSKKYEDIQKFVHNNLFRCWYNPNVGFDLSVSSNYDWFSNNPRFSADDVRAKILSYLNTDSYKLLRFFEDDATISASLLKIK